MAASSSLNAALGFRHSRDLGGLLARAGGEQLIKRFGIDAALLGDSSDGGRLALSLVNLANEIDHRPVLGGEFADAFAHSKFARAVLAPITGVGQIAVLVEQQGLA